MLARFFVFFGGLFVLALCAALAAPYLVDWTSYRADFEREAETVLGRKVSVGGTASATLLPFPSVTFTDVTVSGGPGGQPAMTAESFSMDAELAPFMSGEFRIFDMRIVRPRVFVDVGEDGTVDWALRPSTPFDPRRITLEKLAVVDGAVTLRHRASGREHLVSSVNADLSARSFAGPWRMDGSADLDGMPTVLSGSTGAVTDGRLRVRLTATPEPLGVVLNTEGELSLADAKPSYSGTFRLNPVVAPLAEGAAQPEPGFRLGGDFALDAARLAVDQFRFETGPLDRPYTADGQASLELGAAPRFLIEAQGAQVRLDDTGANGKGDRVTAQDLAARLSSFETWANALPKPTIPGTVRVNLPAIVAGDTTVRDIRLDAEPSTEGWRIGSLAATLPGRATLEAEGTLRTGAALGFEGSMLLAVAQPSGFAAWLARDVDEAVRRLPAAGFNAKVALSREAQRFDDLELVLGEASFRGSAASLTPNGGQPSANVSLSGGALDLDQAAAFASIFVGDDGRSRFGGRNLEIALKAGPVAVAGVETRALDAEISLRDEALDIRRLALDGVAGASITATGALADIDGVPTGRIDALVEADDLGPLVALLSQRLPDFAPLDRLAAQASGAPDLLRETRLSLGLRSEPDAAAERKFSLEVGGTTGGSTVRLQGTGAGDLSQPAGMTLGGSLSLRNQDGSSLLAQLGLPSLPLGLLGVTDAELSLDGRPADGMAFKAATRAEGFEWGFDGTMRLGASGTSAEGDIRLEANDIEPWMQTLGSGLPGFGLGTPVSLRARADYADGLLVLGGLEGAVDEEAVSGDVNLVWASGVPEISGALTLDGLDLARAASLMLGADAFDAGSESLPSTPFRQTPAPPFTAALELSVANLALHSDERLEDARFALRLDGERLAVEALTAKFRGGAVEASGEVKNGAGTAILATQFAIRGADLGHALPLTGLGGRFDAGASLTASGKTVGALVASLSGSGTAAVENLRIPDLDPRALRPILAEADRIGRDIGAGDAARFAPALVGAGSLSVPRTELAFTVVNGTLRAPPVTMRTPEATLSADLRADLSSGDVSVGGSLAFAAGDEALVGSEPVIRFAREGALGRGILRFDTEPLAQFLTQRALEREQARVEAMQAELLERQRLRREVRLYASLAEERERVAAEKAREAEAARLRAEDRAAFEAEAARQAAEQSRLEDAAADALVNSQRSRPEAPQSEPTPAPEPQGLNLEGLEGESFDADPSQ
ncbi:MAG: AsmA protein [Mesorhizobium amorphae]|nr:MAG: AsmA protein [Mesorhizobium amorphae]